MVEVHILTDDDARLAPGRFRAADSISRFSAWAASDYTSNRNTKMANNPPKVHMDALERTTIGNGRKFAATIARVGSHLGMSQIGCSVVELEPGKCAWPHHLHYGNEEFFFILDGRGTLRYDDGEFEIGEGEFFFAGTGPGTAHQIVNTSDAPLRYLALSSMEDPEICYYPDSKKYGSYSWRDEDKRLGFFASDDAAQGYYDGED
jgi:uncharacterized cupin superfamily protein